MNATLTMERIAEPSPRLKARAAGVFYLITMLTGILGVVIGRGFPVPFYAANLMGDVSYIVTTVLLYEILKPVNRSLSLLAAVISLAGCAVGILSLLRLASFPVNSLVFFGFYCLLVGYLISRSTFLPGFLAAAMMLAGLGWLTFLSPSLGNSLFRYTMLTGALGEGALTIWLLVFGVNEQRWKEQAGLWTPGVRQ